MTLIIHHGTLFGEPVEYWIQSYPEIPDLRFMDDQARTDTEQKILSGELEAFCVQVNIVINGVVLGTDWLHNCIYPDLSTFIETGGDYAGMVRDVNLYARSNIEAIQEISLPPL